MAVVPAGRQALPEGFVDELARAFGPPGAALRLSASAVDAAVGPGSAALDPGDPRNGGLVAWLHRAEQRHPVVLYVADPTPTRWTERCLRQADQVLLVAAAGADPGLREVEAAVLADSAGTSARARRHLVLVHPPGTERPAATARWLARRPVGAHHHVRRRRADELARLARHVSGRARGLVLSGGGNRGFAHLGVMQALDDAGVPVDAVDGTSIGAVMGAFYARGLDHRQRLARATAAFIDPGRLVGPTLPLVSLSAGRKVTRLLREEPTLGELPIEDLWLPFFCMSANLTRAEEVVHDRGPTWRALRASISLPGVFPPVNASGDLLVDGAVLNNLPVDVMARRLQGGPIVAVDLLPEAIHRPPARFGLRPGAVGLAGAGLPVQPSRPRHRRPGILEVILRSHELAGSRVERHRRLEQTVELYLRPPLGDVGGFDFRRGPALVELAYRATIDQLDHSPFPAT